MKRLTLPELYNLKQYKALKPPHYLDVYEQYFSRIRGEAVRLVEVGIAEGGSLKLWRDYFPKGRIFGIDGKPECASLPLGKRIKSFHCMQSDVDKMSEIGQKQGPFDVVIDDGAHLGLASLYTFMAFFPAVKPGGIYAIEDWGTGYWPHWPDGAEIANGGDFTHLGGKIFPSHQHGMVGFIKQLIDVCNTLDRTLGSECSQINSMEILPGLVILRKRTGGSGKLNKASTKTVLRV